MKIRKIMKFISLALLLAAGNSNAALIQMSTSFSSLNQGNAHSGNSFDNTYATEQVNLSKFDGSLGDLTGVSISYDTDWSIFSSVVGVDSTAQLYSVPGYMYSYSCGSSWFPRTCYTIGPARHFFRNNVGVRGSATNYLGINLTMAGSSVSAVNAESVYSVCSKSYTGSPLPRSIACSDRNRITGDFNGSFSTAGFALDDFIATNSSDLLSFSLSDSLFTRLAWCGSGDSCSTYSSSSWRGQISVQYSYNARLQTAAVPEPSVIALFSLGLFGLGLSRRRRQ